MLMEQAVARIKTAFIPPAFEAWNCATFYGEEASGEEVVAAARTLPVSSPLRLIEVKNCERLKLASQKALISYLKDPSPTTCLVCLCSRGDRGWELRDAFERTNSLVWFFPLWKRDLEEWVKRAAAALGRPLEPEALEYLTQMTAGDLLAIKNELAKLDSYLPEKQPITLRDLEDACLALRPGTVFALCDAIGKKEIHKAWELTDLLLQSGEPAPRILALLMTHLRRIITAKELLAEGINKEKLARDLNIKKPFWPTFLAQVELFSPGQIKQYLATILECDLAIKSSGLPPHLHLERLLTRICA